MSTVYFVDASTWSPAQGRNSYRGPIRADRDSAVRDALRWINARLVELYPRCDARPGKHLHAEYRALRALLRARDPRAVDAFNRAWAPMRAGCTIVAARPSTTTRGAKLEAF